MTSRPDPPSPPLAPRALWEAAVAVLRANDLGAWTRPAPRLYPHQWSWDSAFIAIGLARVDPDRALRELESLFAAQWADGRIPQIVYNPTAPAEGYFPDAARWDCANLTPLAPRRPATSGLIQPPVHALAAWRIVEVAPDPAPLLPRLRALFPRLLAWHRYLAARRDPDGSGLLTIYHPWESGTDNSPRWDAPLAGVEVGPDLPPYTRRDLQHVDDPSMRPTHQEYDRYLWLVECLKRVRYDDAAAHQTHPFLVKDVLSSALFAASSAALGRLGGWLRTAGDERREPDERALAELLAATTRASAAVRRCWDEAAGLALDLDLRTGRPIRVRTCAGFAPLLVPELGPELGLRLAEQLAGTGRRSGPDGPDRPGLRFAVVPSTMPGSPGFAPRRYWRGPAWPFFNWLLWWGLRQQGFDEPAERLRRANLAQLARPEAQFAEYFEPFTGEPLGSRDQSWTAAVTLDWLAAGP